MANRSKTNGSVAAGALSAVLSIALATAAARAADLGGDCCADLEERVAELEATAATKGNRKMSLSIYGRVHKGLIWFDNGIDSDVYAADMDFSGSRVGCRRLGDVAAAAEHRLQSADVHPGSISQRPHRG